MTSAMRAARNGHEAGLELGQPPDPPTPSQGVFERAIRALGQSVASRIPKADLDDRDPDWTRQNLPLMWLLASIWYRAEVRGLANIPDGPVLLVGNHSGGNMTPDTGVFGLAFAAYFGVERRFHQLAHNLVL